MPASRCSTLPCAFARGPRRALSISLNGGVLGLDCEFSVPLVWCGCAVVLQDVLRALGFSIQPPLPFNYLMNYLKALDATPVCVHVCMRVCVYVCMCVRVHARACMQDHRHTSARARNRSHTSARTRKKYAPTRTHTHPRTHAPTHPLTHPPTHTPIHPPTHPHTPSDVVGSRIFYPGRVFRPPPL